MTHAFLGGILVGFFYTFFAFSSILTAIQFALRQGSWTGFIAGMGHTTAQIAWIAIAIGAASLGANVLKTEINHYKFIPAALLFFLGIRLLFARPALPNNIPKKNLLGKLGAYLTVFIVAISAPIRIVGYLAGFMLMGSLLATPADFITKQILFLGTIVGIIIWWILFSLTMAKFQITPSNSLIARLERITALLLLGLAVFTCLYPL